MNKYLFIGLLLPAFVITTSVKSSGSETEPKTTATETSEKKAEPVAPKTAPTAAQESDDYFDDFDSFFEFPRMELKKHSGFIHEKETVTLPDIEFKKDDEKALLIMVKGLQTSKQDVEVELYDDKGYATIKFPYHEATITIKLWNDELAMSGVKSIIQEKKDEKGNVLSSTSYKGCNSIARTLPRRVRLNSLKKTPPQYKDGILTLTFDLKESKETITVE